MEQDYIGELERLSALKARGVVSEAEFEAKKAELLRAGGRAKAVPESGPDGTYWLPIPSLILGILCVLALFDDSIWDRDTINAKDGSSILLRSTN